MHLLVQCVATGAVFATARSTGAQESVIPRPSPSVDLTVGVGFSEKNAYVSSVLIPLEVLTVWRVRELSDGAIVAGVPVTITPAGTMGGACYVTLDNPTGCLQEVPSFASTHALVGWESGSGRTASVRALFGPGYMRTFSQRAPANAFSLQARIELATPMWMRTALVLSGRVSRFTTFNDDATNATTVSAGFRIR